LTDKVKKKIKESKNKAVCEYHTCHEFQQALLLFPASAVNRSITACSLLFPLHHSSLMKPALCLRSGRHPAVPASRCRVSWPPASRCFTSGSKASKQRAPDQARDGKLFISTNCWFRRCLLNSGTYRG